MFEQDTQITLIPFDYNGNNCSRNAKKNRNLFIESTCHNGHYVISYNIFKYDKTYNIKVIADLCNFTIIYNFI